MMKRWILMFAVCAMCIAVKTASASVIQTGGWEFNIVEDDDRIAVDLDQINVTSDINNMTEIKVVVKQKQGATISSDYKWNAVICGNDSKLDFKKEEIVTKFFFFKSKEETDLENVNLSKDEYKIDHKIPDKWCEKTQRKGFPFKLSESDDAFEKEIIIKVPANVSDFRMYIGNGSVVIDATTSFSTTVNAISSNRQLCRDENNKLHIAYKGNGADVWYGYSTDNGSSWTTSGIYTGTVEEVGIVCRGGDDLLVYYRESAKIKGINSTNGGSSFGSAFYIADRDYLYRPSCEADSNGIVHCAFIEIGAGGDLLYYVNSSAWASEVTVNGNSADDTDLTDVVVAPNNCVYIIGQGTDQDDVDYWSKCLNGFGDTNRVQIYAGSAGSSIGGAISSMIVNKSGTLKMYVSFIDANDLYFCHSTLGSSFTCSAVDTSASYHPTLVANEDFVEILYMTESTMTSTGDLCVANTSTSSISFTVARGILSDGIGHPNSRGSWFPASNRVAAKNEYLFIDGGDLYFNDRTIPFETNPTTPTDISGFPASLKVGNILNVTGSGSTDTDGDTITYYYQFTNIEDATIRQSYSTTKTYTIQSSDAHNTIKVSVKAGDGTTNSTAYNETDFVDNSIPSTPTTAEISGNTTIDDLVASVSGSTDTDSDSIYYAYDWLLNGKSYSVLNMPMTRNVSTKLYDYSTYKNNGTIYGNTAYNRTGGKDNRGSYYFDGSGDYIALDTIADNIVSTGTIVLGVTPKDNSKSSQYIFSLREGSADRLFIRNDAGELDLGWLATIGYNGGYNFTVNRPVLLTFNWTGNKIAIWVNGTYIKTLTDTGEFSGATSGCIACLSSTKTTTTYHFIGDVWELQVFNKSLSQAQIQQLYYNYSEIMSEEISNGQNWTLKGYAIDSWGDNSTAVTSSTTTITSANLAPTAPTDISGFPANLHISDVLNVTASGSSDEESDPITYFYRFFNSNDSAVRQDWSTTKTYTIQTSDAHNTIRVDAKAYDGTKYSSEYNETDIVENTASTTPSDISGFPVNLYVGSLLNVTASGSTDSDNDTISYFYRFFNVNDSAVRQDWSTTKTYTIQTPDAHNTIRVDAKAFDGFTYSSEYNETDIVENTAPTTPTDISGFPANLYVGSLLNVTSSGSTDSDADSIIYYYRFYNVQDATTRQDWSTTKTYTIQSSDVHNTIRVDAKAYDGTLYSSEYNETDVVENTAPTAPTDISGFPSNLYVESILNATASGSTDSDLDSISYLYRFYNIEDAAVRQDWSTTKTYTIQSSDDHDTIRVDAKAYDGFAYSSEYNETDVVDGVYFEYAVGYPSTGCINGYGSTDESADCERCAFVTTDLTGAADQTQIPCEGQNSTTGFYTLSNLGTTNITWRVKLNESIDTAKLRHKISIITSGYESSCSGNATTGCVYVENTTYKTLKTGIIEGSNIIAWAWADFINVYPSDSKVLTMTSEVTVTGNLPPTTPTDLSLSGTLCVSESIDLTASGSSDPEGMSITYLYLFYNVQDAAVRQDWSTTKTYTVQSIDVSNDIQVKTKAYDGFDYSSEYYENYHVDNCV